MVAGELMVTGSSVDWFYTVRRTLSIGFLLDTHRKENGTVEKLTWYEPEASARFDPRELVTGCIEAGFEAMLLDRATLPPPAS